MHSTPRLNFSPSTSRQNLLAAIYVRWLLDHPALDRIEYVETRLEDGYPSYTGWIRTVLL